MMVLSDIPPLCALNGAAVNAGSSPSGQEVATQPRPKKEKESLTVARQTLSLRA